MRSPPERLVTGPSVCRRTGEHHGVPRVPLPSRAHRPFTPDRGSPSSPPGRARQKQLLLALHRRCEMPAPPARQAAITTRSS